MAKVRVRFHKGKAVKYLSHLDILRTFERALRRAGIQMLYSEGFHPKPKLAFASALSVGVTSEAEYADFEVVEGQTAAFVMERLNRVLPDGLKIVEAESAPASAAALMAVVNAASYKLHVHKVDPELGERIQTLLNKEEICVERQGKKALRTLDIRPWIYELRLEGSSICLDAASGSAGNLRIEEVLSLLDLDFADVEVHRTGLWVRSDQSLTGLLSGGTA